MNQTAITAPDRKQQSLEFFAHDPMWQRLWLTLESEKWQTLAVIPIGTVSSIFLVQGLAAVAWRQRSTRVIVADLRSIGLTELTATRAELRRRIDGGERVLMAMEGVERSAVATTIAREADKALLCVPLESSTRAQLKSTLRSLGAQRCLGAIAIRTGDVTRSAH